MYPTLYIYYFFLQCNPSNDTCCSTCTAHKYSPNPLGGVSGITKYVCEGETRQWNYLSPKKIVITIKNNIDNSNSLLKIYQEERRHFVIRVMDKNTVITISEITIKPVTVI